ncbi:MAG: hypothetical protein WCD16_06595 [Paracoccaceae bacterium]
MTFKTVFAALILALTPALAMAECGWKHQINANQCAEGQTFDAATGTCVEQTSS